MNYIIYYSEKLKKDASIFEQQKRLIESQLIASKTLYKNMFKKKFKKEARIFLKKKNMI